MKSLKISRFGALQKIFEVIECRSALQLASLWIQLENSEFCELKFQRSGIELGQPH